MTVTLNSQKYFLGEFCRFLSIQFSPAVVFNNLSKKAIWNLVILQCKVPRSLCTQHLAPWILIKIKPYITTFYPPLIEEITEFFKNGKSNWNLKPTCIFFRLVQKCSYLESLARTSWLYVGKSSFNSTRRNDRLLR